MNRLVTIVAAILLVAGIATVFFMDRMDGLIANAIETEGSKALGTQVTVGSVSTNIQQGVATVTQMEIANPPGFSDSVALRIPKITAEVNYTEQAVKEIIVDDIQINAELIGTKNNFQTLLSNIPGDADEQSQESDSGDTVISIGRLVITNTKVNLKITQPELGEREFVMNDFVMTGLTGTVDELSEKILAGLTRHISNQISSYASREVRNKAVDKIKDKLKNKLGDKLKGLGL